MILCLFCKRWPVLLENICITQAISEFSPSQYFALVPDVTMFIFLLVCKYGLWMVHLCFHSMGEPPPPLLYFFSLLAKVTFWQCFCLCSVVGCSGSWIWTCRKFCVRRDGFNISWRALSFCSRGCEQQTKQAGFPFCTLIRQHTCQTYKDQVEKVRTRRLQRKSLRNLTFNVKSFAETLRVNFMLRKPLWN